MSSYPSTCEENIKNGQKPHPSIHHMCVVFVGADSAMRHTINTSRCLSKRFCDDCSLYLGSLGRVRAPLAHFSSVQATTWLDRSSALGYITPQMMLIAGCAEGPALAKGPRVPTHFRPPGERYFVVAFNIPKRKRPDRQHHDIL